MRRDLICALGLKQWVQCSVCKKFVLLPPEGGSVPEHDNCGGASYSYIHRRYEVDSPEQALKLAKLIANDDGRCLVGSAHTLACADGQECTRERLRLSTALAEYMIEDLEGAAV